MRKIQTKPLSLTFILHCGAKINNYLSHLSREKVMNRIDYLKKYLEEDPADIFTLYALGVEYQASGRLPEAIGVFEEVHKKDSAYLAVYYQLGKCLENAGHVRKAIDIYKQGRDLARLQKKSRTLSELNSAIEMLEDEI